MPPLTSKPFGEVEALVMEERSLAERREGVVVLWYPEGSNPKSRGKHTDSRGQTEENSIPYPLHLG